ncbi:MAG TPA: hypothetical protein VH136_18550 [Trebonia sp.]|jgi:hypothetical protein|nr:hypothetical protein [Trebonia sp.]
MEMPRQLSEAELAGIEQRADLCFHHGDPAALREQDVADLIREIRELWALRRSLLARTRQMLHDVNDPDDGGDPP